MLASRHFTAPKINKPFTILPIRRGPCCARGGILELAALGELAVSCLRGADADPCSFSCCYGMQADGRCSAPLKAWEGERRGALHLQRTVLCFYCPHFLRLLFLFFFFFKKPQTNPKPSSWMSLNNSFRLGMVSECPSVSLAFWHWFPGSPLSLLLAVMTLCCKGICFDVPACLASQEAQGRGEPGHLLSLALACLLL